MSVGDWIVLALISLVVGFFIGSVGVGGILLIPALALFAGIDIHQATATALFSFIFTGLAGTWLFQRRGSIDWKISLPILAGAMIFSYLGAKVNAMVSSHTLMQIIASLIFLAGVYVLLPTKNGGERFSHPLFRGRPLLLILVGALSGFGSGLTGAGGPVFSVPMMLVLGFLPLTAIGASQALQIVAAVFGSFGNLQFGSIDYALAIGVTLFELIGIVAGAKAAHVASSIFLRRSAAGLCLITGLIMLLRVI